MPASASAAFSVIAEDSNFIPWGVYLWLESCECSAAPGQELTYGRWPQTVTARDRYSS